MVDLVIQGAKIYSEQGVLEGAALGIEKNKIAVLDPQKKITGKEVINFPENYHLIPGFIDLHIHGADGKDVMDGDAVALQKISAALAREGTTAFLATTMTANPEKISAVLKNIHDFMQTQTTGATVLGAHLEGPFLSPNKVGAQRADKILSPDVKYIQQWQKESANAIKLVTIAPELPNSLPFIEFLRQQNIVASIGHTDATYAETVAAINAGCSHMTHLFNAMRGLHQREPGPVAAGLLSNSVSAELIADGIHLHPAILELILKIKSKEKIILVTDAMRAKCMSDGVYDLGDQEVEVKNQIARLRDGTLAGSTLKMSDAIRNMMKFTNCSLVDVIKFAAENPAKTLNIFQRKGSVALNKDADLTVLDEHFGVVMTVCGGKIVYNK